MRKLSENIYATVDLGVVLMVGIAFAALTVGAYIIWEIRDQLVTSNSDANVTSSIGNVTTGFDDAVNLLLVAITIFILAIAIGALLLLRSR